MEEKRKWDLIALASIPLIMTLGNSMLIPILPTIEKKIDISSFQASLLITIYSVVAIIFIPIAGFLSDEYGRKKIIIPSLVIVALGGLISGIGAWLLSNPYWVILIGRLIQGIGVSGTAPIVLPLIGDMYKSESEISSGLGIIETSNTVGKVLSPIVGVLLASTVWFIPFLSIPLFSLISILLVFFLVKAPKNKEKAKQLKIFLKELKQIFSQKGRWLYAIFGIGSIIMFVLFGFLFYLSEALETNMKIMGIKKGLVIAMPLAVLSFSSFITGKIIGNNKKMMKWIIFFGLLLLTSTLFFNIFFKSVYIHLIALLVGGIGIGVTLPSLDALITEGIKKEERGTITSIFSSMRFVGVASGPPLVAILLKQDIKYVFIIMAFTSSIAILLSFFAIKPKK